MSDPNFTLNPMNLLGLKSSLLPALLLLFLVFDGLSAQILTDSLQLYYPMDGNAQDASGNGFDGLANASLTEDRFGNANSAYYFNGIDEYIDWPDEPALKPELPISVSAWINLDIVSVYKGFIVCNDYPQNISSGVLMNISSTGKLAGSYCDGTASIGPGYRRTKVGETDLVAGQWYHVAIVIRGATDMDLYVNCQNDGGTYNGTGGSLAYTENPGTIGRRDAHYSEPAYHYQGKIDEVRFWNRALSEEDIQELMAVDPAPECSDGDCSNGLEVWDNATCECVEGEPPVDPGCDDGVCANGLELWDGCECLPGVALVDPGCDDSDCENGFEFWDELSCSCFTIPAVFGCTTATANNYDPLADCDDGSCEHDCEDPGCDDLDCSNGLEVWNAITCACESGEAPIDPGCDDGDCSNGLEMWNDLTCECETGEAPLNPGCDDGDCSNGLEYWDGCTCVNDSLNACEEMPAFPNAFSPNGDGINDQFGAITSTQHSLALWIFDRWGKLLFYSEDAAKQWDGSYRGENCSLGVYVFYAEIIFTDGKKESRRGNVTLIR